WSPSGNDLLFVITQGGTNSLWRLSLPGNRVDPFANIATTTPTSAAFSPNGKWVAYNIQMANASVTGANHVTFVQPFPPTGAIYQISSNDDGHHPVWSRDGHELFYIPGPGRLNVVNVSGERSFTFSTLSPFTPPALIDT